MCRHITPGRLSENIRDTHSDEEITGCGNVYRADITGLSKFEEGVARPYPDINPEYIEGNFGTRFKVNISNLQKGENLGTVI